MLITVKNYRGIEEAELTLSPIALVAGPNGAGKTSIAQATAAALTGSAVAIEGVNKGDAGLLLRDGAKRGRCTVADDHGSSTANWPGASTSGEGEPPAASAIACGLESIAGMKPKDAAQALLAALKAEPTREELAAELAKAGIGEDTLGVVWAAIESGGWDAAHKRAVEAGTKRKGAWEHITGERYGVAKAASWRAPGTPENVVGLDQLLEEQQGALEAAIAHQAVGEAEVESMRRAVQAGEGAADTVQRLEQRLVAARAAEQELANKRQALPAPEDEERTTPCPHCEKPVVIAGATLRAPSAGVDAAENARRRGAISEAAAELRTANLHTADVNSRLVQARSTVETGKRAGARLAEIPEGGSTAEDVAAKRAAVAATQRQIDAARRTQSAEQTQIRIAQGQFLIDALAPTGLRQVVLTRKLGELNEQLRGLSETAGWARVALTDELSVRFGDRPYVLLSASEQFRCRITLQVALADRDGSAAVVIDAADILDRAGRNGLFKMLEAAGMPALVCMTMNRPDDVPDLAKARMGRSYWLGGGVAAATGNHR